MTRDDTSNATRDGPQIELTHLSYSSLTSYLKCGKAYELSRILKLPERPMWSSIGGRAVHEATEDRDRKRFKETGT